MVKEIRRNGARPRNPPKDRADEDSTPLDSLGDLWLSGALGYQPPSADSIRNALVCLGECKKRGFAPVAMGPGQVGGPQNGIMLCFPKRFELEFLNDGVVRVTFKISSPARLAKLAEAEPTNHKHQHLLDLLNRVLKDQRSEVQPLPKGLEFLVTYPTDPSSDGVRKSLRMIRDVVLGRVGMLGFLRLLAPEHAKVLDAPEGTE